MTDFNKRNWPLDIACTLALTPILASCLHGIATAVDSLTRREVASAQAAKAEDPLETLRNDPATAGAFVPIAAPRSAPPSTVTAETETLWRSNDELAVDTIAWHDSLTKIHRH